MTNEDGVRARIDEAMAQKQIIGILYNGGSNPGGYREILPLKVTKTGKLQAKCMTSNATEFFVFENIELAAIATPE